MRRPNRTSRHRRTATLFALVFAPAAAFCTQALADSPIVLRDAVVIANVTAGGRSPMPVDHIAHALLTGTLGAPGRVPEPAAWRVGVVRAGDTLTLADGTDRIWSAVTAGEDGAFTPERLGPAARGGYALFEVTSERDQVRVLEASGHAMVFVNAEPRVGDPYAHGYVRVPVALRAGRNTLLFRLAGRGPFRARLVEPESIVEVNTGDLTTPDVVRLTQTPGDAETHTVRMGLTLLNTTTSWVSITGPGVSDGEASLAQPVWLPPTGVIKLPWSRTLILDTAGPKLTISIELEAREATANTTTSAEATAAGAPAPTPTPTPPSPVRTQITLDVRDPWERHKRTFISEIDKSVQYYSVVPLTREAQERRASLAADPAKPAPAAPALVLSLHGASVEATSQAAAYRQRDWCVIICPTNRRPFGFDWEDWGRIDALEVLADAERTFATDPARRMLTGHSMGGHGTWHLGVTHPGLFAAIAPSAGWGWFDEYAGRRPTADEAAKDPIMAIFRRAASTSDTPALIENLRGTPILMLHGDADDNVPLRQAQLMRERLDAAAIPHVLQVRPGAGHWWDDPATPGADCVDWPAMFDMFAAARLAPAARDAEAPPIRVMHPALLALPAGLVTSSAAPAAPPTLPSSAADSAAPAASSLIKSPRNAGLFKYALMDGFAFYVDDTSTPEDTAAALSVARYLAERWWYQGNGFARFMRPDTAQPNAANPAANVASNEPRMLAIGVNAGAFLPGAPVAVGPSSARLGERTLPGRALLLITYPAQPTNTTRAAITASDANLLRAAALLPIYTSGVGFPDFTLLAPDFLANSFPAIRAAGFFSDNWTISPTDTVIRESATPPPSPSQP